MNSSASWANNDQIIDIAQWPRVRCRRVATPADARVPHWTLSATEIVREYRTDDDDAAAAADQNDTDDVERRHGNRRLHCTLAELSETSNPDQPKCKL